MSRRLFRAWTLIVFALLAATARADRAFTARYTTNDTGDITMAANTLMTASSNAAQSGNAANVTSIQNGTNGTLTNLNNNANYMTMVDVDGDASTFNSSTASLNLPSGATVLFAGLYWGADTSAGAAASPSVVAGVIAPNSALKSQVKFATPGSGYTTVNASQTDTSSTAASRYSCFADVTTLVQAAGNGVYTTANVQAGTGSDHYAGWSLVVVFRAAGYSPRNLTVFDGMESVASGAPVNITLNGFRAPASGAVNFKMGLVSYEGDLGYTGDQLKVNNVNISDAQNPNNNSINSMISDTGVRSSAKNPDYINQLGFDAKIIQLANSGNAIIANNATTATVNLTSTQDQYYPIAVTTVIDLYAPQIVATKAFNDLNGGNVTPGDDVEYTIDISNSGGDSSVSSVLTDVIPMHMTYVPGSLQISSGANSGAKTDASSDDQGEFDSGNNRIVVRLGTGANATTGGTLVIGASAQVKFRAKVNAGTLDGTPLKNQAIFSYSSLATGVSLAASTNTASVDNSKKLGGTIFEDVNYGGGAGRDLTTSGGVPRPGARVELYNSAGSFVSATTTGTNGQYTFVDVTPGSYTLRVVSSTVTSSRTGYVSGLLPVLTFVNGDLNRVGGEDPARADAGNGSTTLAALSTASTVAQSMTVLNVGISDMFGVDFGFNFDTVVSTHDSGQGTLRQFILNANALGNAGLAPVGQTAGKEVSIFMISDGAAHSGLRAGLTNQLTSGVAVITPTSSALPQITDANTTIDGTTQTTNIGDTNAGALGTGGTVGTDALALSTVNKPEVQIVGNTSFYGFDVEANNATIRGVAMRGSSHDIHVGNAFSGTLLEQDFIGTNAAAFSDPGAGLRTQYGVFSNGGDSGIIRNSLIGFTDADAVHLANASDNWQITANEIRGGGLNQALNADNVWMSGGSGTQITGNLLTAGYDANIAGLTSQITNNTITSANFDGVRDAGTSSAISKNIISSNARIAVTLGTGATASANRITANGTGIKVAGSGNTISQNEVLSNTTAGIVFSGALNQNRITQNSIYGNMGLGIDLGATGVTANDGTTSAGSSNNGMDYPVVTSAMLNGSTLTLRGYIGSAPGQSAFGGATMEIFKADNSPADQNGAVIAGDGLSVPHGEGRTYLGTITAAADGTFSTTLTVSGLALSDTITATATDASGNTSEFGAIALVTSFQAGQVSGFVYLDANHNALRDTAEAGTGLTLFAKIFPAANPAGPAQQAVAVNSATGAYAFSNVSPGNYTIIIDDNSTLSDVTPTLPAGWSGTDFASRKRTPVGVTSAPIADQNFGLIHAMALTGRVFSDTGSGGGVANDGMQNGLEAGLGNVAVKLTDNTGATLYDSAVTNGNGDYVLLLPQTLAAGTTLKVMETNGVNTVSSGGNAGTTGGTYSRASDMVTFAFSLNTTYSGVNFANVPDIVFNTDGAQTNLPGSFVIYAHTFTVQSAGQVSFSLSDAAVPAQSGWSAMLYRDSNGDGKLNTGEPAITGPITLAAGETVSILIKQFIPADAPFNAQDKLSVTASFVYANTTPALSSTASRADVTTVGNPVTAGLTLIKAVDKQTARPGDTITYTISYANNSSDVLSNVVVYDNTPAFTTFASASNGTLPASLTAVTLTAPSAGATGAIRWTFTGTLAPGGSGTVTFRVTLAQ